MTIHHRGLLKTYKTILFQFLLILVVFSLSGCAGWYNVRNLSNDSLDEGFSSTVLARVRIIDKTNLLMDSHVQLHFLSRKDNEQRFDWIYNTKKEQTARWIKKDGVSIYEGLLVGQARPGDYQVVNCHIFQGSYAVNAAMEKKPLKFALKQGEILYLGTIEIVINTITFAGREVNYNYSYVAFSNSATQSADRELFQTLYPQLSRKFGSTVNAVSWK
jgi:hypothetical protein